MEKDGVWHHLDGCKGAKSFLFPVQTLSKVFRAKFLSMLTSALKDSGEVIPQYYGLLSLSNRDKVRKVCRCYSAALPSSYKDPDNREYYRDLVSFVAKSFISSTERPEP